MTAVAIIDYGMGNLVSVAAAVTRLKYTSVVTSDIALIEEADRIILPGVGAFGDAMRNLADRGLIAALRRLVEEKHRPLLGICLGAQLICRSSDEFGQHSGFGWIDAEVRRLQPQVDIRIPHVGWNSLSVHRSSALLADVPQDALFYFVHSHAIHCLDSAALVADCTYGTTFAAVIENGPVAGVQFHPEKSQRHGLTILGNFLRGAS